MAIVIELVFPQQILDLHRPDPGEVDGPLHDLVETGDGPDGHTEGVAPTELFRAHPRWRGADVHRAPGGP